MSEYRVRETGEVKSQGQIRLDNKNMSLPRVWSESVCEALGVDPVLESPAPAASGDYKVVVRDGAVQDAKGNWVQSSGRPLAGYTCVLGLMVNFLVAPIAAGFGLVIPQADAGVMMPLLLGMLGLGGARSFERVKGVGK